MVNSNDGGSHAPSEQQLELALTEIFNFYTRKYVEKSEDFD